MAKFKLNAKAVGVGVGSGAGQGYAASLLGPRLGPAALNIALGAYFGVEAAQYVGGVQLGSLVTMGAPGTTNPSGAV